MLSKHCLRCALSRYMHVLVRIFRVTVTVSSQPLELIDSDSRLTSVKSLVVAAPIVNYYNMTDLHSERFPIYFIWTEKLYLQTAL